MGKIKDIIGQQRGRLTVIEFVGIDKNGHSLWKCKCECGKTITIPKPNFYTYLSCGCLKDEKTSQRMKKHGWSKHPLYTEWKTMKRRCYDKKMINYRWYGGKGITVCDEWKNNAPAFIDWALRNGWQPGLSIDRIDTCKNYEPQNCRWITKLENVRRRWGHEV